MTKTHLYNDDYAAVEFDRLNDKPYSFPFAHIGRDGVKWSVIGFVKDSEFKLPDGFDAEKTFLFKYDGIHGKVVA